MNTNSLFPKSILILCLLSLNLQAQTNVSGFINSNTVWNLSGSPYIITGNTIVSQGITLTISPGVIIKFNTNKVLQIDGELIAIGTISNRIIFTSNQPTPSAGDWGKIQFSDMSNDAVFDTLGVYQYGSILKHCDILYAGGIGYGSIHLTNSAPYLSNCNIENSSSSGIYSFLNTFIIDSSSVKYCDEYGIHITLSIFTTNLKFHSNTVSNNTGGGLYVQNNFHLKYVSINECTFSNNAGLGGLIILTSIDSVIISNNTFSNNNSQTASGGGTLYLLGNKKCVISCNRFYNNQSGGNSTLGLNSNLSGAGNYIVNNIFTGNTSTLGFSVMEIYSTPASAIHNVYILNNYISNNSSTTKACIKIGSPYFTNNTLTDHYIENNTFVNNNAPSLFEFYINATVISSNNFIHLKRNNIINPLCNYEIENTIPFGVSNIEAENNYWGTTNVQLVDASIYDFFDLGNLSVVYNLPILTAPILTDTTCPFIAVGQAQIEIAENTLKIYPIPAQSFITVELNNNIRNGVIEIFNLLGEMIKRENFQAGTKIDINLENIKSGMYLLKVYDEKNHYTNKFIRE